LSKILVVGPSWVGDMVMAQTLFKALKQQNPEARLEVLAPDWSRPILERMPEVSATHAMPVGHGKLNLTARFQLAKQLKKLKFDEAIVLPNSWKSALIPWLAKIPKRTGFLRELRFGLLNDFRVLDKKRLPKMIERYHSLAYPKNQRDLPEPLLPRLEIGLASRLDVIQKFALQEILTQPILALCPGAEFGASKRWPEEYYAKVAAAKQQAGWSVWIFGSKNDAAVAARIQAATHLQCVDFTGKTSLAEAIDLLSLATAVVTNDSGLMHIAASLQKPLVAVYGSTDPGFTPPLGEQSKIVRLNLACSPCFKRECPLGHHHCMQQLSPETVMQILKTMGA
jgi:heptosyltransferase-2